MIGPFGLLGIAVSDSDSFVERRIYQGKKRSEARPRIGIPFDDIRQLITCYAESRIRIGTAEGQSEIVGIPSLGDRL